VVTALCSESTRPAIPASVVYVLGDQCVSKAGVVDDELNKRANLTPTATISLGPPADQHLAAHTRRRQTSSTTSPKVVTKVMQLRSDQIDGQRDRGNHPPNFHFRSKPFLHFHNGPDPTYADVRFGGDFDPVTASTPKQREVLLEQV
jgi:hypothetical protein